MVSMKDGLRRVRNSMCPTGGWHFASLVTGGETFPKPRLHRSGGASLPVIGAADCQHPGGRGHVGL